MFTIEDGLLCRACMLYHAFIGKSSVLYIYTVLCVQVACILFWISPVNQFDWKPALLAEARHWLTTSTVPLDLFILMYQNPRSILKWKMNFIFGWCAGSWQITPFGTGSPSSTCNSKDTAQISRSNGLGWWCSNCGWSKSSRSVHRHKLQQRPIMMQSLPGQGRLRSDGGTSMHPGARTVASSSVTILASRDPPAGLNRHTLTELEDTTMPVPRTSLL